MYDSGWLVKAPAIVAFLYSGGKVPVSYGAFWDRSGRDNNNTTDETALTSPC